MGSGGIPIRFRRTETDIPVDGGHVGEPMINMVDNSLGVFVGTGNFGGMVWYPGIDPATGSLVLKKGQKITGKDSNGDTTIELDFSSPDQLDITHTPTNTTLATFSSAGSVINAPNITQVPGAYFNVMTHPGFIRNLFEGALLNTINQPPGFIGPNTYVYKAAGAVGDLDISYDENGPPLQINGFEVTGALKVIVSNGPTNGAGIRTWLFDTASNINLIGYISIYADVGKTVVVRMGNPVIGYNTETVIGNGSWQRVGVEVPDHGSNQTWSQTYTPVAFDIFDEADDGTYWIAEPTMQSSDVSASEIYQRRSVGLRLAEASRYYWTPHFFNMLDAEPLYVNLPHAIPFYDGINTQYDVDVLITDTPTVVSNKTGIGFEIRAVNVNFNSRWRIRPRICVRGDISDVT